jgi:hypothetical protein
VLAEVVAEGDEAALPGAPLDEDGLDVEVARGQGDGVARLGLGRSAGAHPVTQGIDRHEGGLRQLLRAEFGMPLAQVEEEPAEGLGVPATRSSSARCTLARSTRFMSSASNQALTRSRASESCSAGS